GRRVADARRGAGARAVQRHGQRRRPDARHDGSHPRSAADEDGRPDRPTGDSTLGRASRHRERHRLLPLARERLRDGPDRLPRRDRLMGDTRRQHGDAAQANVHAAVRAAVEAGIAAEEAAVADAGRASSPTSADVPGAEPKTRRLDAFLSHLWSRGGALAVIDGERTYRYSDLRAAYRRWCERLAERGVEPGTVVGLRADYSLDAFAALLAMFSRNVVVALLPRDGDVDTSLRDCCAAELLEIDFGARWRRIADPAPHALLDGLRERG